MLQNQNATAGANTGGGDTGARELPELLDVKAVAHLLTCSTRTVYRLSDANSMPRNIKLGALSRWSRSAVMDWIERGCPNCRMAGGAK
jgi:excisionase family DNA binding protein